MLVIGGIVDAGRQHGDAGVAVHAFRRAGSQAFRQPPRIVGNVAHLHLAEQLGEHGHHRLTVFQHVGHAAGGAGIVLQHHEIVRTGAHQIDAHDVRVDPARRGKPHHFRKPCGIVAEQAFGQPAGTDDFLAVVQVVHEGIERLHPLFDAPAQASPFGAGNDAGHHVEGDQPLLGIVLAINIEGDAGLAEEALGLERLAAHPALILVGKPIVVPAIGLANRSVRLMHFIEVGRLVGGHANPLAVLEISKVRTCSNMRETRSFIKA